VRRMATGRAGAPTHGAANQRSSGRLPVRPTSAGTALLSFPISSAVALPPTCDARIAASIKVADSELEKGIREIDLASKFALSRSRFGHLFKAQTGLTFRQYVRTARLARAKLLLRDMRLRVEEVAWRCGYAHTSNLDREFEREFGLAPSEFRRSSSG